MPPTRFSFMTMQGIILEIEPGTASAKYGYTAAEFKNMPVWQVDVSGMNDEVQKKIDQLNQEGSVTFRNHS
jgi:hypothetical protein